MDSHTFLVWYDTCFFLFCQFVTSVAQRNSSEFLDLLILTYQSYSSAAEEQTPEVPVGYPVGFCSLVWMLFLSLFSCVYCCCFVFASLLWSSISFYNKAFVETGPSLLSLRLDWFLCLLSTQGNLVAIKHVNKKRIELTRQVLLELKHVSAHYKACSFTGLIWSFEKVKSQMDIKIYITFDTMSLNPWFF